MIAKDIRTYPNMKSKGCLSIGKIITKYGKTLHNNFQIFQDMYDWL